MVDGKSDQNMIDRINNESLIINPTISVIMCVCNESKAMLKASIESILEQTFEDFELIVIIDNPELDERMLLEYAEVDSRIILIKNKVNCGLTANLNLGIIRARGKYIARMDADDISLNRRFEIQYDYMERHPEIAVVGTYVDTFDEYGNHSINMCNCVNDADVNQIRMLFCNAGVVHSTAFIRKSFLLDNSILYDEHMKKSQDYGLWVDIVAKGGVIHVIPDILLKLRIHANQITKVNHEEQVACFKYGINKQLGTVLNEVDEKKLHIHASIYKYNNDITISEYDNYFSTLITWNKGYLHYNQNLFERELMFFWLKDVLKAVVRYKNFKIFRSKFLIKALHPSVLCRLLYQKRLEFHYKKTLYTYLKKCSQ